MIDSLDCIFKKILLNGLKVEVFFVSTDSKRPDSAGKMYP